MTTSPEHQSRPATCLDRVVAVGALLEVRVELALRLAAAAHVLRHDREPAHGCDARLRKTLISSTSLVYGVRTMIAGTGSRTGRAPHVRVCDACRREAGSARCARAASVRRQPWFPPFSPPFARSISPSISRTTAAAPLPEKTALPATITSGSRAAISTDVRPRSRRRRCRPRPASTRRAPAPARRGAASSRSATAAGQPGLTARTSTSSSSSSSGSTRLDRGARVERHAAHDAARRRGSAARGAGGASPRRGT